MADDDETTTVPLSQVLEGMETAPLEDGDQAVAAWMLVKSRDQAGDTVWAVRTAGERIAPEETLGALTAFCEYLRRDLASDWED